MRISFPSVPIPPVLLVDKDRDLLAALSEGLARNGLRVICAHSAFEGLQRLANNPEISIVVTEVMATEMSGIEFLRKLRLMKNHRALEVIVMTNAPSLDIAIAALRMRVVDFLHKPVELGEVSSAIHRATEQLVSQGPGQDESEMQQVRDLALPTHTMAGQGSATYPGMIAWLQRLQQARASVFPPSLMNEASWNIMLYLAQAEAQQKTVSRMELYIASGTSNATAHRRLHDLKEAGLIVEIDDETDARRAFIELTPEGSAQIQAFVARLNDQEANVGSEADRVDAD